MASAAVLHWISNVPVGLLICIFGLVGNAASVFIWFKILKKRFDSGSSTSIYLISLGVVDSLLLVLFILIETVPSTNASFIKSYAYAFFYSYIGFPLFYFLIVSSIWLLVGVTLTRCIIVNFPVRARIHCSKSRTLLAIAITLAFTFIINIPHFFSYAPTAINGTYAAAETEYGRNEGAKNYEFWVHCMFLVLVPWGSITAMNLSIIWSMRKRVKKSVEFFSQKKIAERKKQQDQVTWMLLAVSFTFLILLGAQCITQCLWMLGFNATKPTWNIVDKSYAAAKLGIVINSSINWLLYCATGSEFRKELAKLCNLSSLGRNTSVVPSGNDNAGSAPATISIPVNSSAA